MAKNDKIYKTVFGSVDAANELSIRYQRPLSDIDAALVAVVNLAGAGNELGELASSIEASPGGLSEKEVKGVASSIESARLARLKVFNYLEKSVGKTITRAKDEETNGDASDLFRMTKSQLAEFVRLADATTRGHQKTYKNIVDARAKADEAAADSGIWGYVGDFAGELAGEAVGIGVEVGKAAIEKKAGLPAGSLTEGGALADSDTQADTRSIPIDSGNAPTVPVSNGLPTGGCCVMIQAPCPDYSCGTQFPSCCGSCSPARSSCHEVPNKCLPCLSQAPYAHRYHDSGCSGCYGQNHYIRTHGLARYRQEAGKAAISA